MGDDTALHDLCDAVFLVLADGVPGEQLSKLRRNVDIASWKVRPPDRETWGATSRQQEQMARLARSAGGGGQAPPVAKPAKPIKPLRTGRPPGT